MLPAMSPPQQPPAYVVTKPGGLSGGAHAVNIVATLATCGIWLIPYLIIWLVAQSRGPRQEVMTPFVPGQPVPKPVVVPRAGGRDPTTTVLIGVLIFVVVFVVVTAASLAMTR